jgi:acetyl-CoA acetyltransferase
MSDASIYAAVRTPFGRYAGGLSGVRPDDLAAAAITGLLAYQAPCQWWWVARQSIARP